MTESISTLLFLVVPILTGAAFGVLSHWIQSRRPHKQPLLRIEPTLTWNGPYPSIPLADNRIEPTL